MSGWTLAFQTVNFFVLAAILQRFLFKPVRQIVARRQAEIEAMTRDADSAKLAAQEVRERYERDLTSIGAERERLLTEAREHAEHDRSEVLARAAHEAQALLDAGRARLETERLDVERALSRQALGVALELARRLLSETQAGSTAEPALERLCRHLDGLSPERMQALKAELGNDAEIVLAVEPALEDDERERWTERLGRYFDARPVKLVNERALLGGAELRLPHTTLSFSWRDALERAKTECLPDGDAR